MNKAGQRLLFVTGTDTGVGKTVLTLLLLRELKRRGEKAIALKPFCSGDREDARRIVAEMRGEKTLAEINPYFSKRAVAPGVPQLLRKAKTGPSLREILRKIHKSGAGYDWVVVEGAGGVMVPLTGRWMVIDLIEGLGCPAVVVGRNQLGTINHSVMTIRELQRRRIPVHGMILMENCEKDSSQSSNQKCLSQLLPGVVVRSIPKLSNYPKLAPKSPAAERILKITLAKIWAPRIVWPR